jgi:hypothetical protein
MGHRVIVACKALVTERVADDVAALSPDGLQPCLRRRTSFFARFFLAPLFFPRLASRGWLPAAGFPRLASCG